MSQVDILSLIRQVPDYPKEGIFLRHYHCFRKPYRQGFCIGLTIAPIFALRLLLHIRILKKIFSLDEMIDENYLGKEVCHWQIATVGFTFMATGAKDETIFSAIMRHEDLLSMAKTKTITHYFLNDMYPRAPSSPEGGSYSGTTHLEEIPAEHRNQYFRVVINVKPM